MYFFYFFVLLPKKFFPRLAQSYCGLSRESRYIWALDSPSPEHYNFLHPNLGNATSKRLEMGREYYVLQDYMNDRNATGVHYKCPRHVLAHTPWPPVNFPQIPRAISPCTPSRDRRLCIFWIPSSLLLARGTQRLP